MVYQTVHGHLIIFIRRHQTIVHLLENGELKVVIMSSVNLSDPTKKMAATPIPVPKMHLASIFLMDIDATVKDSKRWSFQSLNDF